MKTENRLVTALKNKNRTLLEVYTGVVVLAILATIVGSLIPGEVWKHIIQAGGFYKATWAAAALAMLSYLHMHRSLDRALDFDEGNAQKLIFRGYLIRYASVALILILAALTGWLDPLILCLGYLLLMKAAAYMQPGMHRFYNFIFHEEDPVPEPLIEETVRKDEVE